MCFAIRAGAVHMFLTKRRVIDVAAAAGGILVLLLALVIIDQGVRHGLGGGLAPSADFAAVGEDMNYLAVVVALMATQVARGELVEHLHLLVFTATAAVLVAFLMRM